LTLDQVRQLAIDNVVNDGSMTLDDLGIDPTAAEVVLPEMLEFYRRGGPYAKIQPV
jgi:NADH dehydrogenase